MDNSTPPAAQTSSAISFTFDDAIKAAESIGALASAINPAAAGAIAAIEGAALFVKNTLMPAIAHYQTQQLSVIQQAQLALDSAAERVRVGAPAAVTN